MPAVEFEPTISAGERPQTYVSDRAATVTGFQSCSIHNYFIKPSWIRRLQFELNFSFLICFETPWKADSAIASICSAQNNRTQKCADSPLCPKTMSKVRSVCWAIKERRCVRVHWWWILAHCDVCCKRSIGIAVLNLSTSTSMCWIIREKSQTKKRLRPENNVSAI
jgi:hypothetical protein